MTWDNGDEFAFPLPPFTEPNGEFRWPEMGLTKRELFAAMALQGMLACSGRIRNHSEVEARLAVDHADALITALEPKK